MTAIDQNLVKMRSDSINKPGTIFVVTPVLSGAVGALGGWTIKTIANVSAPHYAIITGITCAAIPLIDYALATIGLKMKMQHYKVHLLIATGMTVFNSALITICVAKRIFPAPFMTILATTYAAFEIVNQLGKAWDLYKAKKAVV